MNNKDRQKNDIRLVNFFTKTQTTTLNRMALHYLQAGATSDSNLEEVNSIYIEVMSNESAY